MAPTKYSLPIVIAFLAFLSLCNAQDKPRFGQDHENTYDRDSDSDFAPPVSFTCVSLETKNNHNFTRLVISGSGRIEFYRRNTKDAERDYIRTDIVEIKTRITNSDLIDIAEVMSSSDFVNLPEEIAPVSSQPSTKFKIKYEDHQFMKIVDGWVGDCSECASNMDQIFRILDRIINRIY